MIRRFSNNCKLFMILAALLVTAGIVFEVMSLFALSRIVLLLLLLGFIFLAIAIYRRANRIEGKSRELSSGIVALGAKMSEQLAFAGKIHRELRRRIEEYESMNAQLQNVVTKQALLTRQEIIDSSKSIHAIQENLNLKLIAEFSGIDDSNQEMAVLNAKMIEIETRVRKINNAFQRDIKELRQDNSDAAGMIQKTFDLGVQNSEVLNLLERRIVNKLRVSPELTNVRNRVERMERRIIGLIEHLRTESDESVQLASDSILSELHEIARHLASQQQEFENAISNQASEFHNFFSNEKSSIYKTLNAHQTTHLDKWIVVETELRKLSDEIELRQQDNRFGLLSTSLETQLQDLRTHLVRLVELVPNENLSEQSVAKLSEEIERVGLHSRKQLRKHITETVRDSTRQIEALVKLAPRLADVNPLIPPTGGYALDAQALLHLIDVLERVQPKVIVEFGCGASTIWMAYICRKYDTRIISFDHLNEYLIRTQAEVDRHGFSDMIDLRLAPLEEIEIDDHMYSWYSLSAIEDLADVDLLFIDGPPESTGANARRPALYVMSEKLSPDAVVVLDDTHRESEQDTISAWLSSFPEFQVVDANISRLTVLE